MLINFLNKETGKQTFQTISDQLNSHHNVGSNSFGGQHEHCGVSEKKNKGKYYVMIVGLVNKYFDLKNKNNWTEIGGRT